MNLTSSRPASARRPLALAWGLALAALVPALHAQQGDKAGEVQQSLVPAHLIPPAPVLPPEAALKSFRLEPGFKIELVAAEPLVRDPVALAFGPDGRLWVVEMSGYMPRIDGQGEEAKVGTVAVLTDTDGDGRMDQRTVFLDQLVMPRALALVGDGVLVAEPPNLWFCRDTNGDGKADERKLVANDYARQSDYGALGSKANPEHASNGLMWALDNWIYSANHTTRYRYVDGEFQKEPTNFRGQWGMSQDDFGRLVYNSNSDQLRLDLIPTHYLNRNPFHRESGGANVDPVKDQRTYPARVNPGINRGYQTAMLKDGRLAKFTAACGPVIYRGSNFPPEYQGNAFVCEPSGNLVKRNVLTEKDGVVTGRHAYADREFLASTDERFRPVNAYNGPDGALYLVDFYRGLIQHRIFLTSYLRGQTESRGLQAPTGLGRIYRITHTGRPPAAKPNLAQATPAQLVASLASPEGWTRDTAQRLLVEKNSGSALAPLQDTVRTSANPLARLHALWTLAGMQQVDAQLLLHLCAKERHPAVLAAAIRLAEPLLQTDAKDVLLPALLQLQTRPEAAVHWQLVLTLGPVAEPAVETALVALLNAHPDHPYLRDALLSGLALREDAFLARLLADAAWRVASPAREGLLKALARSVFTHGKGSRVETVLNLTATARENWQQQALLDGMLAALPGQPKGKSANSPPVKRVKLAGESAALKTLLTATHKPVKDRAARLDTVIVWPNKPGVPPEPPVRALTPAEQEQFATGKMLFEVTCAPCHQSHGYGMEGLAPPLVDSEWVARPASQLARILLHGLRGPITVKGRKYDLDMPSVGSFEDEQLAAILTYIRREWDHPYDPVATQVITDARKASGNRDEAWTEAELKKLR